MADNDIQIEPILRLQKVVTNCKGATNSEFGLKRSNS